MKRKTGAQGLALPAEQREERDNVVALATEGPFPTPQGGGVSRERGENLFQKADPARTNKRRKRQRARARYSLQSSVQELRTGYIEGLLGALAAR